MMKLLAPIAEQSIPLIESIGRRVDYTQVKMFLDENKLNFSEIGARFGVTRERIRQLADAMGYEGGHDRNYVRALGKRELKPATVAFMQAASKHEIEVEEVHKSNGLILANMNTCFLREAVSCKWHSRGGRYIYDLIRIYGPRGDAKFCAWHLPDGRFLIMPYMYWPSKNTYFRLEESADGRKGNYGSRHHYRDCIEAWHLLKGERQ